MNDETGSTSGAQQPEQADTQAPTEGFIHNQEATEKQQQPTVEKHDANDTPQPIFPTRVWCWLVSWWTNPYRPRGNFPEHFTVGVTIIIGCIAAIQACIYQQQKDIGGVWAPLDWRQQ